jgi:hypothetical protein
MLQGTCNTAVHTCAHIDEQAAYKTARSDSQRGRLLQIAPVAGEEIACILGQIFSAVEGALEQAKLCR